MTYYFEVPVDGGQPIRLELDPSELGIVPAGRDRSTPARATESLQQAIDRVRPIAVTIIERLRQTPTAPDKISAEFGIKFSAEAGALIARTSAETHLNVTLTWEHIEPTPE